MKDGTATKVIRIRKSSMKNPEVIRRSMMTGTAASITIKVALRMTGVGGIIRIIAIRAIGVTIIMAVEVIET